jgi:hypothetical protein
MPRIGTIALTLSLFATLCFADNAAPGVFAPASTNVWGAEYPRIDASGRAQFRIKAPDATKVGLNFWSGPKLDMAKQPDASGLSQQNLWSPDFTITPSKSTAPNSATPEAMLTSVEEKTRAVLRFRKPVPLTISRRTSPTAQCAMSGTSPR